MFVDKKSGPWILGVAKILFGTLAISLAVIPVPVMILAFAMHFFGGIGSLPRAWKELKQLSWKSIVKISALGVPIVITDITYFFAIRMMDVSLATLVRWTAPLILVLGLFLFTTHRQTKALVATLIGFGGLLLVLSGSGIVFGTANWTGVLLGLLSALSVAIFWYSSKQVLRQTSPMVVMFLRSIVACLVLIPFLGSWSIALPWWPHILAFGIVYGFMAAYIDTVGIQRTPAAQVGLIGYIVPVTSLLGAGLILGETFTPLMAIGGLVVLASGLWAQRT